MAYVAIRIDEGAAEMLNRYAAEKGLTKSQAIISALKNNKDEADQLLEQLDKKSEEFVVDPLIRDLGPDELPECCQSIYADPKSHCEHWEDRRPVGYWNKLTHKWANDPDYIQYV